MPGPDTAGLTLMIEYQTWRPTVRGLNTANSSSACSRRNPTTRTACLGRAAHRGSAVRLRSFGARPFPDGYGVTRRSSLGRQRSHKPARRYPFTESNFRFRCFCNGPLVVKLQSASNRRFRASVRGRRETATSCCKREWRSNLPGVVSGLLPATATEPASPSPRPGDGTSWELSRVGPLRTVCLLGVMRLLPRPDPCPRRTPSRPPTSDGAQWPAYVPAPPSPSACPAAWRHPRPSASGR